MTPPPPPPPVVEQPQHRTTGEVVAPPPRCGIRAVAAAAPSAPLPPHRGEEEVEVAVDHWLEFLLFLLLGGGALAGVFFLVVKPRLDQMAAERNPNRPVENTNVSTPTPAAVGRSAHARA